VLAVLDVHMPRASGIDVLRWRRAVRVVDGRATGPLLRNRAWNALTTLDARRMVNRIAKTAEV
jgi:CheY-like chemotaxis protein